MKVQIVFRSCSKVTSVHGAPRIVSETKEEIIRRCLASLLESASFAQFRLPEVSICVDVLDDHSSEHCLSGIEEQLDCYGRVSGKLIHLEFTGNGASLKANYDFARASNAERIYFVEDDYLHESSAVLEMLEAQNDLMAGIGRPVVIFPVDYPDRYRDPYPSLVAAGRHRHWRSVKHTTATLLLCRDTLLEHWEQFQRFAVEASSLTPEDLTINRIYHEVPCFSPLPSLAAHLGEVGLLPPYLDWRSRWDQFAKA